MNFLLLFIQSQNAFEEFWILLSLIIVFNVFLTFDPSLQILCIIYEDFYSAAIKPSKRILRYLCAGYVLSFYDVVKMEKIRL
jgi:hypothetical protein